MKVGDLVKNLNSESRMTGIIIEFVPTTPSEVTGEDIVRCFWPTGFIDKVWRKGSELEVISESR